MNNYIKLLKEARDLLVLCAMIDKSGHCQNMVIKIDKEFEKLDDIQSINIWNDADIDAAYIMGAINTSAIEADKHDVFPSITKITKELERLKSLGFDRPCKAVKNIRYPKDGN